MNNRRDKIDVEMAMDALDELEEILGIDLNTFNNMGYDERIKLMMEKGVTFSSCANGERIDYKGEKLN